MSTSRERLGAWLAEVDKLLAALEPEFDIAPLEVDDGDDTGVVPT